MVWNWHRVLRGCWDDRSSRVGATVGCRRRGVLSAVLGLRSLRAALPDCWPSETDPLSTYRENELNTDRLDNLIEHSVEWDSEFDRWSLGQLLFDLVTGEFLTVKPQCWPSKTKILSKTGIFWNFDLKTN